MRYCGSVVEWRCCVRLLRCCTYKREFLHSHPQHIEKKVMSVNTAQVFNVFIVKCINIGECRILIVRRGCKGEATIAIFVERHVDVAVLALHKID